MKARALVAIALLMGCTTLQPDRPLFRFHSNFWLKLHHYLRVVGRGTDAIDMGVCQSWSRRYRKWLLTPLQFT